MGNGCVVYACQCGSPLKPVPDLEDHDAHASALPWEGSYCSAVDLDMFGGTDKLRYLLKNRRYARTPLGMRRRQTGETIVCETKSQVSPTSAWSRHT